MCRRLSEAVQREAANFDLRKSTIGAQWYRALKMHPDLQHDYAAAKGREEQTIFRAAWAQKEWKKIAAQRIEIKEESKENSLLGDFVSVKKRLIDQGSDEAAFLER